MPNLGFMRKLLSAAVLVVSAIVAVESLSSYALYRYFALHSKELRPAGSATLDLLRHAVVKFRGGHQRVLVSSDHMPVFRPDDELGYVMNPGEYTILEEYDHQKHGFNLRVNEQGHRVTSFLPVNAAHRLFFTGDSSMFGWGLHDEQTVPWLLQSRLADHEVINLTLNSYSSLHALLQLRHVVPAIGSDDTVILLYHPVTNGFNVASMSTLEALMTGYELQLGERAKMLHMKVPYGFLTAKGALETRRIELSCVTRREAPDCVRPVSDSATGMRITQRIFDDILALGAGHILLARTAGADPDPVIEHLRELGVAIVDLRPEDDEPDALDILPTNKHAGPFWQYRTFTRLLAALGKARVIQ